MKFKLNKTEFDSLPEAFKVEYNLEGEEATLKLEGGEDVSALKNAKEHEKEARKLAEDRLREAEVREQKLKKDLLSAGGDEDKLKQVEARHQKEIETLRNERQAEVNKFKEIRNTGLIQKEVAKLAESFTIPSVISPTISQRLAVEEIDGQPVVRVVNPDGSPSVSSISDLKKEFLDNKDYSSIIKANVGSGSGANSSTAASGASADVELSKMSISEKVAFKRENPEQYEALTKK